MNRFRVSFLPVFLCVFLGSSPIVLAAFFEPAIWSALILRMLEILCAVGVPVGLVTAWVYFQYLPVRLSEEGLTGASFWGFPKTTAWDNIKSVKPFRILNLRWLRVYSKDGTGVNWVALFLGNPKAFKAEVKKARPKDNLFLYELEKT